MSYMFFQAVLEALGKKLSYESISNLYGRTVFDKKGGEGVTKVIENAYPLSKPNTKNSAATLMSMPSNMMIIETGSHEEQMAEAQKQMGDTSWFEEYLQ